MFRGIEVLTHSSIRIRGAEGTIYVDPYQLKDEPRDADFILVTHDHFDHFSVEDIQKAAGSDTILVVPENMKEKAQEAAAAVKGIETIRPGGSLEIRGLKIEAVPSYNINKQFHPKEAGWVGYIVTADGKRIYIAGDTDATREAAAVKCDVALIPIGGTYTMDAKEAAELINEMKPGMVIPTHYGSVAGKPEDAEIFTAAVAAPIQTDIRMQY